jgi:2,5-furandicarboxylate decarboxylase 1
MKYQSMREWLGILEEQGKLKHVTREVSKEFEIAAVGKKACGKYALIFDHPIGSSIPVVTGLTGSRDFFSLALDVPVSELASYFEKAQANPMNCKIIDQYTAPVKEVITKNVDLYSLPIPIHHEKDSAPYLTAGVVVAKNPETGDKNVSIHRLQVTDKNHLGILMLPRHLMHFQRIAEEKNQPLEIAIVIGLDPIAMLSSQALTPLGQDEFCIASALYGKPMELVKCETVDIEVPAHAEIVLEGVILPKIRKPEGPFGEYPKYYGPREDREYIELTCMTTRKDPIFQTIVPATDEHLLLGGIPREGGILQIVKNAVPTTSAVHLTPGGTGRYHLVIQMEKKNEGEAKNAMCAAFGSSQEIKHVVVVDRDVDIFNTTEVSWAIATRCQAARDVMIISGACGNKLDPSTDDGLSDKMGIDATVPLGAPKGKFEKIRIPGEDKIKLEDYISG